VRVCSATEVAGIECGTASDSCDPGSACNALLVCAASDPKLPAGCPISRRSFKQDIRYLLADELAKYRDELLHMRLATWRYKDAPERQHLGIIIDDAEGSVAVESGGERVDVYGYTSLAVATLQLQAVEIEALKHEIAELRARVDHRSAHPHRRVGVARR
jgi:hypothetical protein